MTAAQQAAFDKIQNRVNVFKQNVTAYTNVGDYASTGSKNETDVRTKFIDLFWEALGWDMHNLKGKTAFLEEVMYEGSTERNDGRIGNTDYAFRDDAGNDIFFVEAKRPSVVVKKDSKAAYQIRDYAYNKNHPIGILTDFEEFAIYDCTAAPQKTDNVDKGLLAYYTYEQYTEPEVFAILWDTFARENVLRGSLVAYQQRVQKDKSYSKPVDKRFLLDLEDWRKRLAQAIIKDNPTITIDDLVFVVQATINRIVFMRICEDRNIEPAETLKNAVGGVTVKGKVYQNLLTVFKHANARYNAGLFDVSLHNSIAENIYIDNFEIRKIIEELYFPHSPYRFEIISPEILGVAYEQFLGKTIRLERSGKDAYDRTGKKVPGYNAIVEYKPDVRKAGGVFYTPQYIVNYIVAQTVGKLVEGKTPNEVALLTFCDPACGSGSFLLGVYQFLIKWHTQYYSKHPTKAMPNQPLPYENGMLTIAERKRILTNNIYGVDIDAQAVEVAKLSLLLTCLADNQNLSPTKTYKHLLPNIDQNIQCGNSLIDTEFDWKQQFKTVFKNGGFDAVVGNPPYGASLDEQQKVYLKEKYKTFGWRGETYVLFTEKATNLLKINGLIGYIIPDTYLNLDFTKQMRDFLLQNTQINQIVALPSNIFKDATVDTTILLVKKEKETTDFHKNKVKITSFNKKATIIDIQDANARKFEISTEEWFLSNSFNVQSDKTETKLIQRIDAQFKTVNDIAEMFYGIKAYQVGKGKPAQTADIRDTKPFTATTQKTPAWKPMYDGKHIGRYTLLWNKNNWIHYGQWLAEPRQSKKYEGEKILIRKIIGDTLIATYVPETSYCNTLLFVLKLKENVALDYLYVLGILNSKFIGWYFRKKFQIASDDTFPQIMIRDILQFAIPTQPKEKTHDKLVALVTTILSKKETAKSTAAEEIAIDGLVYELYGLTEAEIQIVEGV